MATDIIVIPDTNTNETISFVDSSDYATLGISISDVNGIRYLFATYNSILNKGAVAELLANTEYIVTIGTFVLNGTTYVVDDVFVAYEDFTLPTSGVTVETTGYYCLPNLTIPSVQIESSYTPSQIGEDATYFEDNFKYVRYEIYDTIVASGNLDDGYTYLVQGTQNSSIELGSGEIYYVGQVFTLKQSNYNYTSTGTAYAVLYKDGTTFDFWTDYNATQVLKTYEIALANSNYNLSEDFRANYIKTITCLSMPYIYSNTGDTYSAEEIQQALDYVNTVLANTNKDIRNA